MLTKGNTTCRFSTANVLTASIVSDMNLSIPFNVFVINVTNQSIFADIVTKAFPNTLGFKIFIDSIINNVKGL